MKPMARNAAVHTFGALAASLMFAVAGPAAAHPHSQMQGSASSSLSRYEQQRQACLNGTSGQNRQTCLREAGAARQAERSGNLATRRDEVYMRNRTQRCNRLPQVDRDECAARIAHPSDTSGSVADGGVLYEYREIVPAGTPGSRVIPGSKVVPGAVVVPVAPGAAVVAPAEAVILPKNPKPSRAR